MPFAVSTKRSPSRDGPSTRPFAASRFAPEANSDLATPDFAYQRTRVVDAVSVFVARHSAAVPGRPGPSFHVEASCKPTLWYRAVRSGTGCATEAGATRSATDGRPAVGDSMPILGVSGSQGELHIVLPKATVRAVGACRGLMRRAPSCSGGVAWLATGLVWVGSVVLCPFPDLGAGDTHAGGQRGLGIRVWGGSCVTLLRFATAAAGARTVASCVANRRGECRVFSAQDLHYV
jgi:hypothetical protein